MARNGAGLAVSDRAPEEGADATVSMTADAFAHLLRGEIPPRGSGRRSAATPPRCPA